MKKAKIGRPTLSKIEQQRNAIRKALAHVYGTTPQKAEQILMERWVELIDKRELTTADMSLLLSYLFEKPKEEKDTQQQSQPIQIVVPDYLARKGD